MKLSRLAFVPVAAALALAGIGAVAFDLPDQLMGEDVEERRITVAVLPFGDPSGDTNAGRTFASIILDRLGRGQGFDLVSSTSSAPVTNTLERPASQSGSPSAKFG